MLLLSLLNFLSGNLRQAVANPLRQGAVIEFGRTLPQGPFFGIIEQWVVRFGRSLFCHTYSVHTLNWGCTTAYGIRIICVTRMTAFIAGCQQSEIPGSPDFTRPSICDCLERVFLCTEAS